MKKLLAMVLALVMTLSLAVSANAAFKDDKDISADYAEAAAVLDGMGVFEGIDGSFLPKDNITRAQVAAIIYRVATADTAGYGKDKSGLYATYNKFSDMLGAGWAQGYIGYCANAEYVKGYPDGTFKPSGNVTGYEVLAMILRAVGYDKNGEFSGADWAINVAKYANQLGILDNVDKSTDLSAPASRELVAEMLFRAIQVPTVTYTPAFGYQDVSLSADKTSNKLVKANSSIGYANFKLVSGDDDDAWGRPTTKWFKDKNEDGKFTSGETVYAEITAPADASFNEATAQCDICSKLGEKTSAKIVETYTNGVKSTDAVTYKATATKETVGAQGEQIEFYEVKGGYRLVIIDTYLAKVTEVVTEKTDKGSHVTRDDYLVMTVYAPADAKFSSTIYADGNDYAKDEYVLVNVNEEKDNNVEFVGLRGEQNYVEIVGKADSLVAAQTSVRYNSNKHTIDGKDYLDAVMLIKDEAGSTKNVKYTWFFDQFGNLIGSVGLDRSTYAVLKSIKWVDAGNDGYAVATLVEFDGKASTKTVTVNTIDGISSYDWVIAQDDSEPYLKDASDNDFATSKTPVGEDENSSNKNYRGVAMYMVETNDDDTVNLQGIDVNKSNQVSDLYVDAVASARLNAKSSMIVFDASSNSTHADSRDYVIVTDETEFVVRSGEGTKDDPYVYESYTGTDELPAMADYSISLMYNYDKDSNVADYVYISDYTPAELDANLLFVYQGEYTDDDSTKTTDIYSMKVLLDGAEKTVKTSNKKIIETLANNVGKLFSVTIDTDTSSATYGEITSLDLVNVSTEELKTDYFSLVAYTYLVGDVKLEGKTTLTADGYGVYAKDADVYVWNEQLGDKGAYEKVKITDVNASDLKDSGVWVVCDEAIVDRLIAAKAIYIGAKLDDQDLFDKGDKVAALSFKYTDSDAKDPTKVNTFTQYFTVDEETGKFEELEVKTAKNWKVVDNSYTLTVSPVNSFIGYNDGAWLVDKTGAYYTAANTVKVSATGTATVTTENGYNEYDLKWSVAALNGSAWLTVDTARNDESTNLKLSINGRVITVTTTDEESIMLNDIAYLLVANGDGNQGFTFYNNTGANKVEGDLSKIPFEAANHSVKVIAEDGTAYQYTFVKG